jgi:hypothetical protein
LNLDNIVDSILVKSKRLVDQKNNLLEENKLLSSKIKELEAVISNQELKINDLIETQKVQQIAGVLGKDEKKTSLKKIDEVVREIDRCMALLNN